MLVRDDWFAICENLHSAYLIRSHNMPRRPSAPKLPELLQRKFDKTGETRGASNDAIYQNRVSRTNTVLIPYGSWSQCRPTKQLIYEKGYIVYISPDDYFGHKDITKKLAAEGLVIGENALVYYETRKQWTDHSPTALGWDVATKRTSPLGGKYVARIPATTAAKDGKKINRGFAVKKKRGVGIRVYEYASRKINSQCKTQLEALFWMCHDADTVAMANEMEAAKVAARKADNLAKCIADQLLDIARLKDARILNNAGKTICPLCLKELSAQEFFDLMKQAEGREVTDLTNTQVNLFHIEELRTGILNHRPYNVGWGHHHCNVVAKDSGIIETLQWMHSVVDRNIAEGHLPASSPRD
jgi:hypothetical protein